MITSKQRSNLIKLANNLDTLAHIGKNGITDAVVNQISELLELKELVKIGVQKSFELSANEIIRELAEKLKAEPVHAIGSKIVLYRKSKKEGVEHIKF